MDSDYAQDWRECWSDWMPTRYERKALREGRPYLTFEKRVLDVNQVVLRPKQRFDKCL